MILDSATGDVMRTYKLTYSQVIFLEMILKVSFLDPSIDGRFATVLKEGVRKLAEYFLYSSSQPLTVMFSYGGQEQNFCEVVKNYQLPQFQEEGNQNDYGISLVAFDSYLHDISIVQSQFGNCSEQEAINYTIIFLAICDEVEKNEGSINQYVTGQPSFIVVEEVTPLVTIFLGSEIPFTRPQ